MDDDYTLIVVPPALRVLTCFIPKRSHVTATADAAVSETTRTWTADTSRTLTDTTRTTTRDLSTVGDAPHQQYQQIDEEDDEEDDEENGDYAFLGERSPLMMMQNTGRDHQYFDSLRKPSADNMTTSTAQPEAQPQLEQNTLLQMFRTPRRHTCYCGRPPFWSEPGCYYQSFG